jgi:hypothetical protein
MVTWKALAVKYCDSPAFPNIRRTTAHVKPYAAHRMRQPTEARARARKAGIRASFGASVQERTYSAKMVRRYTARIEYRTVRIRAMVGRSQPLSRFERCGQGVGGVRRGAVAAGVGTGTGNSRFIRVNVVSLAVDLVRNLFFYHGTRLGRGAGGLSWHQFVGALITCISVALDHKTVKSLRSTMSRGRQIIVAGDSGCLTGDSRSSELERWPVSSPGRVSLPLPRLVWGREFAF